MMSANDTTETFGLFIINCIAAIKYIFLLIHFCGFDPPPFFKIGLLANPGEGASPSFIPPSPRTILTHFSQKFFQKYF